jgi:adenosylhomocysteine nucleosidase
MRVLVTFAVDAEFAPWRKLRDLQTRTKGDFTVYEAQVGRASVDFVVTGMGVERARRCTEAVLSPLHTICIAAGFAGALKPEYKVGDVLAARAVRQLGKSKTLECARNLFHAACRDKAIRANMFLTAEKVIRTAEEKRELSLFGDAVDMESFAIVEVASEKKRPAIAIRVISDRLDRDMPAKIDMTVDMEGNVKIGGVVKYIARHPLQVPALIRLGRGSYTAAQALCHFLEAYIQELSFRSHGSFPQNFSEVTAR